MLILPACPGWLCCARAGAAGPRVAVSFGAAPLTLALTLACGAVQAAASAGAGESASRALAVVPLRYFVSARGAGGAGWARLLLYPLAHRDWGHLLSNLASVLLAGPAVEARLGSARTAALLALSAAATGLAHACAVAGAGLIGASGIALTLLVLLAAGDLRAAQAAARGGAGGAGGVLLLPLPLLLLLALHAAREVGGALAGDAGVSHFAHLLGLAAGAGAGLAAGWA
jgi:membrane associated rhomboid family serine protease